mgnify:CR=1 FL=1
MNNPQNSPPKAIIYTRVSTENQSENTSFAAQYEACKARAAIEGAQIIAVYEDTNSGGLYHTREKLQMALSQIERGAAQMLILAKLDRTGRELESLRDIRRRIENAGGRLVFADGMNFEKNAVGNLMFTQLGAFAEFEREIIRERMVAGLERTAREGRTPSRSNTPYGYLIVTKNHVIRGEYPPESEGHYFVVDSEAPAVRLIFEAAAAGKSLRKIASELNASPYPPRGAALWNITTIRGIIQNETYIGRAFWRKTARRVDERRAQIGMRVAYQVPRERGEFIPLSAPPIVSETLFREANAQQEMGRETRSGNQKHRYLLSGFVFCPACGDRFHSRGSVRIIRDEPPKRQKVYLYRCAGATRGTCSMPSFGGPQLENFVACALQNLLEKPEIAAAAQAVFIEEQKRKAALVAKSHDVESLKRRVQKLREKEVKIADAIIEAQLENRESGAFQTLQINTQNERRELEKQISNIEITTHTPPELRLPQLENLPDLREILLNDEFDVSDRASLLQKLAWRIYPVRFSETTIPRENQPRESAKGQSTRTLAGVKIVLKTSEQQTENSPTWVLSYVAFNRYKVRGSRNYMKWKCDYETKLEILENFPFPARPKHTMPSRLERKNLRQLLP